MSITPWRPTFLSRATTPATGHFSRDTSELSRSASSSW
nr:MAG: hypothetical protein [Molluscum contagiosum virus]